MSDMNITNERASFQAIFALDIMTAAGALILLGLASKPTFRRIKARRFTSTDESHGTPLKTALGTYLFLWPALFFLLVAYTARFVSDVLQTNGSIAYDSDLTLNGRPSYSISYNPYGTSVSTLSFLTALTTIFFTVLQTGGVWIHSSHIQSNGTGRTAPNTISRIWNALIMLAMLATGLAAWGLGMTRRDTTLGSLSSLARLSWSNILDHEDDVRAIYIAHQCIVVAASLSVTGQVLKEYSTTNKTARGSSESHHLVRFAFVVVPLIWLRDIFIIYDITLLFVDTSAWSVTARLVTTFLLIIFGQFANVFVLAMVLWGAWRMGRTVNILGSGSVA